MAHEQIPSTNKSLTLYAAMCRSLGLEDIPGVFEQLKEADPKLAKLDRDNFSALKDPCIAALISYCRKLKAIPALIEALKKDYPFVLIGVDLNKPMLGLPWYYYITWELISSTILVTLLLLGFTYWLWPKPIPCELNWSAIGTLNSVVMSSPDEGWAVGDGGKILQYAGKCWSSYQGNPASSNNLNSVRMAKKDGSIWAVGDKSEIISYTNGAWQGFNASNSLPAMNLQGVYPISSTEFWAAGYYANDPASKGVILNCIDGNCMMPQIPLDSSLYDIYIGADGSGWAVGSNSILYGKNGEWTVNNDVPNPKAPVNIFMLSQQNGFAVGDSTALSFDGSDWKKNNSHAVTNSLLRGVYATSSDQVWAVGDQGMILKYDAKNWMPQDYRCQNHSDLKAVYLTSAQNGWAVGDNVILHFDGNSWGAYHCPTNGAAANG